MFAKSSQNVAPTMAAGRRGGPARNTGRALLMTSARTQISEYRSHVEVSLWASQGNLRRRAVEEEGLHLLEERAAESLERFADGLTAPQHRLVLLFLRLCRTSEKISIEVGGRGGSLLSD